MLKKTKKILLYCWLVVTGLVVNGCQNTENDYMTEKFNEVIEKSKEEESKYIGIKSTVDSTDENIDFYQVDSLYVLGSEDEIYLIDGEKSSEKEDLLREFKFSSDKDLSAIGFSDFVQDYSEYIDEEIVTYVNSDKYDEVFVLDANEFFSNTRGAYFDFSKYQNDVEISYDTKDDVIVKTKRK